jgi:hypothetical protein
MRNLCTQGAMALVFSFVFSAAAVAQSPTFGWGIAFNNYSVVYPFKMTTDMAGNLYTIGFFNGRVDFDASSDTFFLDAQNGLNFICKHSPNGEFIWAKQSETNLSSIDYSNGHLYISGRFGGTKDIDLSADTLLLTATLNDSYIAKIDTAANLLWHKAVSSSNDDLIYALSVDNNGHTYFSYKVDGLDSFDIDLGLDSQLIAPAQGAYIYSKLDNNGNFMWAQQLPTACRIGDLKTNGGHTYLSIFLEDSTTLDGIVLSPAANSVAATVAKIDNNTGSIVWAKSFGRVNSANNVTLNLNIDNQNRAILTFFADNLGLPVDYDPSNNVFNISHLSATEITKVSFDLAGNFVNAINFEGSENPTRIRTYIDEDNYFYITGTLLSSQEIDFDLSPNGQIYSAPRANNVEYIAKYNGRDSLIWLEASDSGAIYIENFTLDSQKNIYVTGAINNYAYCDLDFTAGTSYLYNILSTAGYIFKLSQPDVVAVQRVAAAENIRIWPNPANDFVHIEQAAAGGQLAIIDALGRQLLSQPLTAELSQIATHDLSNGLYFFHIQTASGGRSCQKVLIQR